MLKSQLAHRLDEQNPHLDRRQIDAIVSTICEAITEALARHDRIELRALGSFSTKTMLGRRGRNPRTGASIDVPEKAAIVFRLGRSSRPQ